MDCAKVKADLRKGKKKPVKDELDRMKQAEKKKRRLEKALATSAAIRSELEKKKMMKKEEQERLDEEGAATAEAAALHVLLDEDIDDSSNALKNDEGLTFWNQVVGAKKSMLPYQDLSIYSPDGFGWVSDARRYGQMWNHHGNSNLIVSSNPIGGDFYLQCFGDTVGLSAEMTRAVTSLKIADDAYVDAYPFNHTIRG